MWDDPYYYVNSKGERFMDEGIYYEHAAKEIARQDGVTAGHSGTSVLLTIIDKGRLYVS